MNTVIDTKDYQARLLTRLKELDSRLVNIEHDLEQPMSADVEERASEREGDEVLESMGNAGLAEIEEINAALGRIEAGNFGICIECGDAISPERLEIMPTAVKCRKCM